jgi:hypothetical protein
MATLRLRLAIVLGLAAAMGLAGCVHYDELQPAYAPPEQPPSQEVMYQTLAPYGDWVETDVYGSVWCPSAAAVGVDFAPYRYGGWGYTGFGYTFASYDSWGWLPYHYGNWVSLDTCGWAWVPGFVWGPAWVGWYSGYPYPIAPAIPARPIHVARPPGVHVAQPVHARLLTPQLDPANGRLYSGRTAAPGSARLVTPPSIARAGFVGFRGTPGAATAWRGGTGTPVGPGWRATSAGPAGPGWRAAPAAPHFSAPVHAAPVHSAPAAPAHAAPAGGGHHR